MWGVAMRKAIFMLLAVVSSSAAAEWVKVGGNETMTIYADPASTRKVGGWVKIWSLFDLKTALDSQGKSYMSIKHQNEYDCNEEQSRKLYSSFHSGNMGEGEVVYRSSDPGKLEPVPPGSVGAALWKIGQIVCEKL